MIVVLAVTVGAVLLVLFVIAFAKVGRSEVCQTPGCENYARLLREALNESVNPCESFTQFVCDRWAYHKQHGFPELVVTEAIEKMTRLVNVTHLPKSGQDSAQRGLTFYRSCDAVLQGSRIELTGVKAALKEAGITWPFRPTEVNIPHVILATSLRLGWDVMFRVIPLWQSRREEMSGTLLLNKGRTIIEIINKTSLTKTKVDRRAYFDVLRGQLQQPHKEGAIYPDEVSFEEVNAVEKEAEEPLRRGYYKPEVIPPVAVPGMMEDPSIGLSRAGWVKTLSKFNLTESLPPAGLEFGTANVDYVNQFLNIWKTLGNDKMHLFVSWCTVQVAALFAHQELIANFYGDINASKAFHGAFCFSRAFAASGPRLFSQYNQLYQTSSTLDHARRIARSVRSAFHKRLLTWSGYNKSITVIADWDSLDTVFELSQGSERATRVKHASHGEPDRGNGDPYKMFPDLDENSLLSNFRKTSLTEVLKTSEYDVSFDVEVTEVMASLSTHLFSATFYEHLDFQLMPYALAYPLYDFELVPGVNFGGFGAEIAKQLGILTLKAYRSSGPLQSDGAIRNCFGSSPFAKNANWFLSLAEALGVGALLDAYKASAVRGQRDKRLPGLTGYSGTQLLFMALCLRKCRGSIAGETPASVCNLPLIYLREFSEAFHCADGTPMNPAEKCQLI
ncbi:hypothetical protein HPB48_012845 [Haemaphysalis longicornis]|uniref:Uncharacterized protein n=1 Tax=Haemaphysalis longicornis TaxID=44386 RepID=A0A9J6GAF2_HAELO|nr:hypothetical protein HPB48_012845 [Haemaphysalis longicornis]